jgi:hypothetical protein
MQLAYSRTPDPEADLSGPSGEIIGKYLEATNNESELGRSASMEVDINASVPKLQENGRLHARRFISRFGRISYRVLGFQGSNTVKSQVIGRYLQAEQQGQANPKMAITPTNYKFRWKGARMTDNGADVYVFALVPRKRGEGLFKGEIWLDAQSYLPVYEKGRLVKNPSIFFKKVDFERAFAIQGGHSIPARMNSVITTRLVGKVELDVNYSNFSEMREEEPERRTSAVISPSGYSSSQ